MFINVAAVSVNFSSRVWDTLLSMLNEATAFLQKTPIGTAVFFITTVMDGLPAPISALSGVLVSVLVFRMLMKVL